MAKREDRVPVRIQENRWWFRNLQLSGFIAMFFAIVIVGVLSLSGDIQLLLKQRAEIAEVTESIAFAEQNVSDMEAERDRWQDPSYIRSQARERLYYVLPGEVSYLVMDADGVDLSDTSGTVGEILAEQRNTDVISQSLIAADTNWVESVVESILRAALDEPAETEQTVSPLVEVVEDGQ